MSTAPSTSRINLAPFRRRVRLMRAWRLGTFGASIGAILAIVAVAGDWVDFWITPNWLIAALPASGLVVGCLVALFERYNDIQLSRSIDGRTNLEDRLTSTFEARGDAPFDAAVKADAAAHLADVAPSRLYPFRFGKRQLVLLGLLAVCASVYIAADTPLLRSAAGRLEAHSLANTAIEVQRIARPVALAANQPGATAADKQLAHDLQKFASDLTRARMTKQEALIRANQLAEQARKLENTHNTAMNQSLDAAQTAGERLQKMEGMSHMDQTQAAQLAAKAAGLQQQMTGLQNMLNATKAGKSNLTAAQQHAIEKKLAALEKQYQQVQLSEKAMETLSKLSANPQYQQAMALIAQMQKQGAAKAAGQPPPFTPEQMRAMAKQLEALAKSLNTDAKMKAYADALLQAAMDARLNSLMASEKILQACGLGAGLNGRGGTSPGVWLGGIGHLHHFNKSSLLNIKFHDRIITSQQTHAGPETYTEESGPSQLTPRSGIPYQNVLPKYEKTAESALSKGTVPPQMRTRVRDYFDSLRQNP